MKAARRRISGEGEFENPWKRLFGFSNTLRAWLAVVPALSRPGGEGGMRWASLLAAWLWVPKARFVVAGWLANADADARAVVD